VHRVELFVFVADADALRFVKGLLERPRALGIRTVIFEVVRHTERDSGMWVDGPETLRSMKRDKQMDRALVMLDYAGCGRDTAGKRLTAEKVEAALQKRLDTCTFKDRSAAIAMEPELESWLWKSPGLCGRYLSPDNPDRAGVAIKSEIARLGCDEATAIAKCPKEVLESAFLSIRKRKPRASDFVELAALADPQAMRADRSFERFLRVLQEWFPPA